MIQVLVPKYRRDGNAKVHSVYAGVASGDRTVTTILKPSIDRNHMEATRVYGPGIGRGQGGRIAVLVLGGMETTLDEMEYIVAAKQEKKFVPRHTGGEIVEMCRLLQVRRNEQIEAQRKFVAGNPSEAPKKKRMVRMYLPTGYRMMQTSEPGFKVLARA